MSSLIDPNRGVEIKPGDRLQKGDPIKIGGSASSC